MGREEKKREIEKDRKKEGGSGRKRESHHSCHSPALGCCFIQPCPVLTSSLSA